MSCMLVEAVVLARGEAHVWPKARAEESTGGNGSTEPRSEPRASVPAPFLPGILLLCVTDGDASTVSVSRESCVSVCPQSERELSPTALN